MPAKELIATAQLWTTVQIDKDRFIELAVIKRKIKLCWDRYLFVYTKTDVSPDLIAAIHYRETSLRFDRCFHNGDKLPGPTIHVPRGRGPFESWEASAVDAIRLVGLDKMNTSSIVGCLDSGERFNGMGYRKKGLLSPYVWAGTNHHSERGKYVADGKFDPNAPEKQLGIAAILYALTSPQY